MREALAVLRSHLRSMYWRQLLVTAGMVLLTLTILGVVFFSLGYRYFRGQINADLEERARSLTALAIAYCDEHQMASLEALEGCEEFGALAGFAAEVSGVRFLLCNGMGRILLSTGADAENRPLVTPWALTERILEGETIKIRGTLEGIYEEPRLIVGLPMRREGSEEMLGAVFASSSPTTLDHVIQGFIGLFFMTAAAVLLIATLVSSLTATHLVMPLRKMVLATRRYAGGDFKLRMVGYEGDGEIGELAAAFNQMADTLQRQEAQRREFISNVSHDLKTPLTTIAGYTDGLLDGTIPQEKGRHYLHIIADESRRLNRLVRRMLDVSQIQAMTPPREQSRFDLCECARRVVISLEDRINARNLDVDADIPEEPVLATGDGDMITQVVYNLLDNAAKFAREGSTLYLGVTEEAGNRARVTVRNEGNTIPPEELPRLFERFHKGDQSRGEDRDGVGLGLYIVKTILEQHHETITVTSENGVTVFSFSLRTGQTGR